MSVVTASWAVTPASAASATRPGVGMGGFAAGSEFPGDVADDLDKFLGHPTHGRQHLAQR